MNESPFILVLRNLVMLACLFGVPLLALVGPAATNWRSPRLLAADNGGRAGRVPPQEAPSFRQSPPAERIPERRVAGSDDKGHGSPRPVIAPPELTPRSPGAIGRPTSKGGLNALPPGTVGAPGSFGLAAQTDGGIRRHAPDRARPEQLPPRGEQEYMEALTERLKAMGAGYYLLECWGEKEKVYRFYCQLGPRQGRGVSFEAVAGDQISAVERVLDQAEVWQVENQVTRVASGPKGGYR